MHRKSLKFLAIAALLFAFACSQNELPDEVNVSPAPDMTCMITIPDTASKLTQSRAYAIGELVASRRPDSRSVTREVLDACAVYDEEGNELLYVVNYADNQGFIILSASKQYYPVLAECDHGNLDPATLPADHPLTGWLNRQKAIIANSDNLPDSILRLASQEWMNYNTEKITLSTLSRSEAMPDLPKLYYDSLERWTSDPTIEVFRYDDYILTDEYKLMDDWEKERITVGMHSYGNANYGGVERGTLVTRKHTSYTKKYGPHLKTTWAQQPVYNSYVPYGTPLGCTVVASGQIMRFHEYPSDIAWGLMPNNQPSDETAAFLYNLGLRIGIDYEKEEDGANIDQVKKALESYGYIVTKMNYDKSKLSDEVQKYPVYLRGTDTNPHPTSESTEPYNHSWVCDGSRESTTYYDIRFMVLDYRPTIYTAPDEMVEGYRIHKTASYVPLMHHYNWGWSGAYDGYFKDDNIEANGYNLNKDRKMLFVRLK